MHFIYWIQFYLTHENYLSKMSCQYFGDSILWLFGFGDCIIIVISIILNFSSLRIPFTACIRESDDFQWLDLTIRSDRDFNSENFVHEPMSLHLMAKMAQRRGGVQSINIHLIYHYFDFFHGSWNKLDQSTQWGISLQLPKNYKKFILDF